MSNGQTYFIRSDRVGFRCRTAGDLSPAAVWAYPLVIRLIAGLGNPSNEQARLALETANRAAFGVQYWPIFLFAGGGRLGYRGLRPYRPDKGLFEVRPPPRCPPRPPPAGALL